MGSFWKVGLPFLVFMVVGAWGWARVLQPKLDSQGAAADRLYGQSIKERESDKLAPVDPNKKKTNVGRPPRKVLPTLEEEFEKAHKEWDSDYVNKKVPQAPGAAPRTSH